MIRVTLLCVSVFVVLAGPAFAATSFFDTFNGAYVGGPIGPMPQGWTYFGYGPPAYERQETGIVLPPYDGSNSSTAWYVPGTNNDSGTIGHYVLNVSVDGVAGLPIDWAKPVYFKVDVYAADYGTGTKWETMLEFSGGTHTNGVIEWGDDGAGSEHWETITTTIAPGQAGLKGHLIMWLNFNFVDNTFEQTNAVIWENVRLEYDAIPEPSSILALVTGMLGLGGIIRRKR